MLILNQAGDEILVMENIKKVAVKKLIEKGVEMWFIVADSLEIDTWIKLGRYADEKEARAALDYLFMNFRDGMRALQMPRTEEQGESA